MNRLPIVIGLALILADATCGETGGCRLSGCGSVDVDETTELIGSGQSWTTVETCDSCGHAHISLAWSVAAPVVISGTISVSAQIRCGDTTATASTTSADAKAKSLSFDPANAKNLCGDNAAENYTIIVTNNANDDIVSPRMTVACPNSNKSSSVAGPSAIRIK